MIRLLLLPLLLTAPVLAESRLLRVVDGAASWYLSLIHI